MFTPAEIEEAKKGWADSAIILADPNDGFLRFLENCVFTKDEERKSEYGEEVTRQFPSGKTYIRYLIKCVQENRLICIPKSRRVMMTWFFAALAVWSALYFENRTIVWQAQTEKKSADTLKDKMLFILEHIPWRFSPPWIDKNRGKIPEGFPEELANYYRPIRGAVGLTGIVLQKPKTLENGQIRRIDDSRIFGVAEGADQFRQYTVSLGIMDECAFWTDLKGSIKGARPSVGLTGQLVALSSASPGYMAEMIERDDDCSDYNSTDHEGIETYTSKIGWKVLRVHYTADDEKRTVAWTRPFNGRGEGEARRGYDAKAWKQEMEIDFSVHSGTPFFSDFQRNVHVAEFDVITNYPVYAGFDFGLTPATVLGQLHPKGVLMIFDEMFTEDVGITQHLVPLGQLMNNNYRWAAPRETGVRMKMDETGMFRQAMLESFIDPAGYQRSQTDAKHVASILAEAGWNPVGAEQSPVLRMEAVNYLLTNFIRDPVNEGKMIPRIVIHPRCKMLIESLSGGCKQSKNRGFKEKNKFSHIAEALEYLCVELSRAGAVSRLQHKGGMGRRPHVQASVRA